MTQDHFVELIKAPNTERYYLEKDLSASISESLHTAPALRWDIGFQKKYVLLRFVLTKQHYIRGCVIYEDDMLLEERGLEHLQPLCTLNSRTGDKESYLDLGESLTTEKAKVKGNLVDFACKGT